MLDFVRQWLNGTQEFVLTPRAARARPRPLRCGGGSWKPRPARTADFFDLGPGDRALVCLNCEYIGGLMMLVRGLERNMHLTIVEPHADPFAYVAADAEFDFSAFVPLQLQAVLAAGQAAAPQPNEGPSGGRRPRRCRACTQELQPLKAAVWLTYGMTETCSHVALRRLNGPQAATSFRVLPGIAAGQDERGCLTLRGDVTDDQLIITNDVVQLLDAHTFEWLGRADFVINSGGVKVPAEKVELVLDVALAEIGASRRCFVAGQPDERLGQAVTAFIEGQALTAARKAAQEPAGRAAGPLRAAPAAAATCRNFRPRPRASSTGPLRCSYAVMPGLDVNFEFFSVC